MADLGDLMGSLMSGLIRARCMADEQTAVLAEHYQSNPLLEGLSVPRIRIPEVTIDVPMLIEDHREGTDAVMEAPAKVAAAVNAELKTILSKNKKKVVTQNVHKAFVANVTKRLRLLRESNAPVTKEAIIRHVQNAFAETIKTTDTNLTSAEKDAILKELRTQTLKIDIIKEALASSIVANIKTADVKERASSTNVVRLKMTLKEEGLEWSTQSGESGGVVRSLQPE